MSESLLVSPLPKDLWIDFSEKNWCLGERFQILVSNGFLTLLTMTAAPRLEPHLLKIVAKTFPSLIASDSLKHLSTSRRQWRTLNLLNYSESHPTKFRSKNFHIQKKSVVHLAYFYSITSRKHNGECTWLIGLDILDFKLEKALVEDGGGPLCNPVSISEVLHVRQCQYQFKR